MSYTGRSIETPKRKYSISDALGTSFTASPSAFEYGGRSYVLSSSLHNANSPTVHSGLQVHEQTENLANIGVTETEDADEPNTISSSPPIAIRRDQETTPLNPYRDKPYELGLGPDVEAAIPVRTPDKLDHKWRPDHLQTTSSPEGRESPHEPSRPATGTSRSVDALLKPFRYLPAVFLGTLLNILDGLSYGMIMFPISEAVFLSLAPAGLSMFYVSTIVSQLVFSLGGSAFAAGIGSEMIEVTPFFHSMALLILAEMGGAAALRDAVVATTIVTYALLLVLTGVVFFALGKFRLGLLVGFFPRHILVGCIGGVGYFLVVTAIEVSARLEGGMAYDAATFWLLFALPSAAARWLVPLALAVVLVALQHRIHNLLLVPLYFIGVFAAFHLVVALVPAWLLQQSRDLGWIFPMAIDRQPWYSFYSLYRFGLVDWWCILRQVPLMLALTFFGILHVPINVPALAVLVGMDQFDVDRELVAHGYSNALLGLVGLIQNYLVYTNLVLFVRAGADDRLAGVLLAVATAAVMISGPGVIGYIPVCVVGALIYLLGYELLKEALHDTWGRVRTFEYTTILAIVVVMGAWDFVYGVLVGILLACLLFVVEAARRPVVSGTYTGVVARLTVLRHPKQQAFLRDVGHQICVVKLQGTVFFGSIGGLEAQIRARFDDKRFAAQPIKFLVLDMRGVALLDFLAAEGFRRILNLSNEKATQLIISGVDDNDAHVKALRDAGLWDNDHELAIQLFSTLNYALEWCENLFLRTYKTVRDKSGPKTIRRPGRPLVAQYGTSFGGLGGSGGSGGALAALGGLGSPSSFGAGSSVAAGTPRTNQILQAATRTVRDDQNRYYTAADSLFKKQPLPLIMITFAGLSTKTEEFWSALTPFFIKEQIPQDVQFYDSREDSPSFFLVESGLVRLVIRFESDVDRELHSSILPLTAFGDLPDTGSGSAAKYSTVSDSVVWRLSDHKLAALAKRADGEALLNELLRIQTKLGKERFDTMTANLVISA